MEYQLSFLTSVYFPNDKDIAHLEKIDRKNNDEIGATARDLYQLASFRFELNESMRDLYIRNRKYISRELESFHVYKKEAQKNKNFQLAKYIGKELIKSYESMAKAFNFTDIFLIGNKPTENKQFPIELVPHIRRIEASLMYDHDWEKME